jgi:cytochrome b subunit of formate dehydrogenase
LLVEVVYHLGAAIYRLYVLRYRPSIVPNVYDVRSAIQALLYNLGLSKTAPQQGRYTFEEKMEYWAMVWGTIVMAITGFMMWNPLATTRFLPGEFIPAAKAAHGGEALLAVLAIIIWHMYGVHIKTFNKSMFNGKLNEKEMLHEHPLELADIKAGLNVRPVTPQGIARRKQLFYPIYGILGALLLFGVYKFVTLEQTAVATAPNPENVAIYAPLTPTPLPTQPPTPTPLPPTPTTIGASSNSQSPALITTWEGGVGALFSKCSGCHGASNQASGLNLSSYTSALAGGKNGPGIVPGKPDQSQIYIIQSQGGHFVQLTSEELGMLKTWIEAGAPEK